MDELAKTEARNYLSTAGFFLLAAFFILNLTSYCQIDNKIHIAIGIGLLVIATLLAILRKRDMMAILFFMMGFFQLFCASTSPGTWDIILLGFLVLVALITLVSKEKVKWLLFLIPVIWLAARLIWIASGYNTVVFYVFEAILAVLCLYYSLACACERCFVNRYYIGETAKSSLACGCEKGRIPGAILLTADESTDFKASGSVLGYMLFALITGGYAIHYLLDEAPFASTSGQILELLFSGAPLPFTAFQTMELLCGVLMIFVAILLLTVGKMRFTPVMFMLVGLIGILSMFSSGAMFIGLGILMIVVGLFAILRKESRILPGIMLIIYGCTWFFSAYVAGTSISSPVVSVLLNAIPALIAIYLSFVVYSQRKLPKF